MPQEAARSGCIGKGQNQGSPTLFLLLGCSVDGGLRLRKGQTLSKRFHDQHNDGVLTGAAVQDCIQAITEVRDYRPKTVQVERVLWKNRNSTVRNQRKTGQDHKQGMDVTDVGVFFLLLFSLLSSLLFSLS